MRVLSSAPAVDAPRWVEPDLERAVIGALLSTRDAWDVVGEALTPESFTGATRPGIFATVESFYRERIPVDAEALVLAVRGQGRLAAAGAEEEVLACDARGTTVVSLVEHYVETIRNLHALREARRIAGAFLDAGKVEDAGLALDRLQRELTGVEAGRSAHIQTIGELLESLQTSLVEESEAKPGTDVISTGFESIDRVIGGWERRIFNLLCARPGIGKSSLLTGFSAKLGERDIPHGVFWLEDSSRMLALRIAAYVAHIDTKMLKHGRNMRAPAWERLQAAIATTKKWPCYVEATKGLTGKEVARRIRKMKRERGIEVVFTDHLGEVATERSDRTDLDLGDAAKAIRDECDAQGICPVSFHQLGQKAEQGGNPRLGWIFNSDILGQIARVVGFVSRDEKQPDRVFIKYVKATYAPPLTEVELGWHADQMRIYELSTAPQQGSFA